MTKKDNGKFYVVGIGASAGGLDPIQQLFDVIPRYSEAAFVVVQHLSPDFVSLMDELLRKHTDMKVNTAVNNELILANRVYLVPRKKYIKIEKNRFIITEKDSRSLNMPIDVFFHSLGKSFKEKAIGIILSGSGTDGSRGIRTIIEEGGIVMVQDAYSAQFDGMPNAALNTDLVDFVGTPIEIAERLVKICKGKDIEELDDALTRSEKLPFSNILATILTKKGIDFKFYKPGTLSRRIEKRIQILGLQNITEYCDYLISDENETNILAKEFLIGVTKFFRNTGAFEVIKNVVIPALYQNVKGMNHVRVWVMACSTGEEAYSLAILLHEYKRLNNLNTKFKIFASDIDETAILKAQQGIYGNHLLADVPGNLLERYFIKQDAKYEVVKEIRENIVFAVHNVLKDPPFINMDMIVSRNFLIYIDAKPQKVLIDKFHFSLNKNGYLFLGSSESLQGKDKEFEVIDNKWRIFQCKKALKKPISELTLKEIDPVTPKSSNLSERVEEDVWIKNVDLKAGYNELLIKHYAPPACLFVNKHLDVLHIVGEVEEFLEFPTTPADFNLNYMIEKNQLVIFKNGVKQALAENKPYAIKEFPFKKKGNNFKINVKFTPQWVDLKQEKLVLIEFLSRLSTSQNEVEAFFSKEDHTKEQIKILELDLLETKQKLKINHEKYEIANEELQAANEELMSSNEEMQSTNEELQSVNEELYTVNAELNAKIEELTALNNDINNLLSSTDIGTIFLDNDLRIRKFTPAVKYQFNIVSGDLGRPIHHFSSYFGFENFKQQIVEVLSTLESAQIKIKNESGRAYLMKINPFITSEQEVVGVVISFIDIEELSQNQEALEESESRYWSLYNKAPVMLHSIDNKGKIMDVSDFWLEEMGFKREEVLGKSSTDFLTEESRKIALNDNLPVFFKKGRLKNVPYQFVKKNGEIIDTLLSAISEKDEEGNVKRSLAVTIDVSERKRIENDLLEAKHFIEKVASAIPYVLYVYDMELNRNVYINQEITGLLGYEPEEIQSLKSGIFEIIHPDDLDLVKNQNKAILKAKDSDVLEFSYRMKTKGGNYLTLTSIEKIFKRNEDGKVIQRIGIAQLKTTEDIKEVIE